VSSGRNSRAERNSAPRRSVGLPASEEASDAATHRLSLYLRALARCEADGSRVASSDDLAGATGVKPALVRKDLAHFGQFGIRGVGYEVRVLRTRIAGILGLDRDHNVVIVGAGNLGMALADYRGFNTGGFRVISLLDIDADKVNSRSKGGVLIRSMRELPGLVKKHGVGMAVLAVPSASAQKALDQIAAAGVRAVLNFVPGRLRARRGLHVRSVDLKIHLEGLTYRLTRGGQRSAAPAARRSGKRRAGSSFPASPYTRPRRSSASR
jgi:redox-sensing transcriptional repressor